MSTHDRLIDRAAARLTEGEPSARLGEGVAARVRRGRPWWSMPAVPALAGAMVIVIAALVWTWPDVQPTHEVALTTPAPVLSPPPPPPRPPATSLPLPQATPRARRSPPARPLEPIDPLVIEPMTMPMMATTTSAGVMPIEIDDLRIEPLQIQ